MKNHGLAIVMKVTEECCATIKMENPQSMGEQHFHGEGMDFKDCQTTCCLSNPMAPTINSGFSEDDTIIHCMILRYTADLSLLEENFSRKTILQMIIYLTN